MRIVVVLALVAACGGGAAPRPAPAPDWPFEGAYVEPPPASPPEPEPEPEPVVVPAPSLGDELVAPTSPSAAASAPYEAAARAYRLGDLAGAIDGLERAYELDPDEAYLFDLAQAYRLLGDVRSALFFYKRYAAVEDRASATVLDVMPVIADLELARDEQTPARP